MIVPDGFYKTGFMAAIIFVIVCIVALTLNSNALFSTSYDYLSGQPPDAKWIGDREYRRRLQEIRTLGCRKLPDILIIGIEKCGTITLRSFLSVHPNIFISESFLNNKFFNADNNKTLEEFTKASPCTPANQLRLEKLATPGIPRLVYDLIPDVKLMVVVREPVERTLSHFVHLVDRHRVPENVTDFDETVKENGPILARALYFSFYGDRVKPWINVFGVDRILFLDGDNFVKDPVSELARAETFIGLPHLINHENFEYNKEKKFYCIKTAGNSTCMQKSKGRPHPVMREETRTTLRSLLRPYNEMFFSLIGQRFPWNR